MRARPSTSASSRRPDTAEVPGPTGGGRYLIQAPETRCGAVKVWSSAALSFDKKPPWQRRLVQDLREALKTLGLDHESALHGTFAAAEAGSFDIENRLFYNVGSSAFPDGPPGVVFERLYDVAEAAPEERIDSYPYLAAYRRKPIDADFSHWQPRAPVARFERVPVEGVTADQASRLVWHAMRRASDSITVERETQPIDRFGLDLTLHLPAGTSVKPVSVVKGIVDGVIGSFHLGCRPGDVERCAELLASKLATFGISRCGLTKMLSEPQHALLPGTAFKVHTTWVQLDPLDELCDAGRLVVRWDAGDQHPQLSGEIFVLDPSAATPSAGRGDRPRE